MHDLKETKVLSLMTILQNDKPTGTGKKSKQLISK